ncbi:hypothetical protein [uncultured Tateyamaria sp.]|uniref:hypothetical protein n=1 Tax=uncultured Tateyamaria sp. TaxID=455651 RepID=UPI00260B1BC9|nr:hypothetical protein [uncultured Tateyamaria sp.]
MTYLSEKKVSLPRDTPGDGAKKGRVRVVDAYSQWIARHGAQFAYTEEIPKVAETDFDFALIVIERDERVDFFSERFDFTDPPFLSSSDSESVPIEDVFFGRLPIREASAGPDIAPGSVRVLGSGVPPLPEAASADKLVISGLIDDSINIGHRRFRDADGKSRVDFAWIHDAQWEGQNSVPFGREFTSEVTSQAIQLHPDDDDALMRQLDLIATTDRPYLPTSLKLRGSHGTHVADLAAGYDPDDEKAINHRIIAVQLPTFASQDTSGASLMTSIIAAARYIFDRALEMSDANKVPIPVVVNFSYGFGGGPKNGKHIVERTLRAMAEEYRKETAKIADTPYPGISAPAEIALPAGNGHLSKTHATGPAGQADRAPVLDFDMRVQPDDRSASFVEIWFSAKTKLIEVTVTPPGAVSKTFSFDISGPYDSSVSLANDYVLAEPKQDGGAGFEEGTVIARISIDRPNEKPAGAGHAHQHPATEDCTPFWRVLLALGPSTCLGANQPACPHGIWKVACKGDTHGNGPVRAWIQRDEAVGGFGTRGRQAYFDDTAYENNRFDRFGDVVVRDAGRPESIVKRDGTVSGIATNTVGPDTPLLSVGGALWDSDRAAIYSAAGNDDTLSAPHFLAPSETSGVLQGILGAATRNGGQVAMGGTSVAAPQVARCLAGELSRLNPAKYASFNAIKFLKDDSIADVEDPDRKARPVLRPDNDTPERAGNRRVREQRVQNDNGLIKPHPVLEDNIMRDVRRKV